MQSEPKNAHAEVSKLESRNFNTSLSEVEARSDEIKRKIDSISTGTLQTIEKQSGEKSKNLSERLSILQESAKKKLTIVTAGAAFLLALNSPAFADEGNTEKIDTGVESTLIHDSQTHKVDTPSASISKTEAGIVVEATALIAQTIIDQKIAGVKTNLNTLNSQATGEEKLNAAIDVGSSIPSAVLGKAGPVLSLLSNINDLRKDLQNPNVEGSTVFKRLLRTVADLGTAGLAGMAIDVISNSSENSSNNTTNNYSERTSSF